VANGPNIFQMLLVSLCVKYIKVNVNNQWRSCSDKWSLKIMCSLEIRTFVDFIELNISVNFAVFRLMRRTQNKLLFLQVLFHVLITYASVLYKRSCSTLSPVSAGMGDRLRAGIPPRYVTKPTRSTQPCIPLWSLN